MTDDGPTIVLTTIATGMPDVVVASARGRVTPATVAPLRGGLAKLLADGRPVLLDVSHLRLEWAPSPEVFVTAMTAAGGWPVARMVLYGADEHTVERLSACRVPRSIPLAATLADAAALVEVRPASLAFGRDLLAGRVAVAQAREIVRDTLSRWQAAEFGAVADAVVTELVRNAVQHARPPVRLRLILDRTGLRISVRDGLPGAVPVTGPQEGGLRTVARLSRAWGTLGYRDGKLVWVQVPRPTAAATRAEAPSGPAPVPGTGLRVSVPRRRRFTTADPELAHAFLRSVYGEHTLRLSDAGAPPDFQLEYDGVATDRFAVERLTHRGAVQAHLVAGDALVVVHPLRGDLRIATRRVEVRVAAGEVLLCSAGSGLLVDSPWLDVEVVRIGAGAIRRIAAELTGFDAPTALARPTLSASPARAALWRATVAHLRRDVLDNREVMANADFRTAVLRHLVATLAATFPTLPDEPRSRVPSGSAVVRRAVAFVEEHATHDIGLADIAAAAGVGARGLQMAFRRHADTTPLEYLRGVRLAGAHQDLVAADAAAVTVGAVATRWGFPHHGTFSTLYLQTYGCSPRVTLRA